MRQRVAALVVLSALVGCDKQGAPGPMGPVGPEGPEGPAGPTLAEVFGRLEAGMNSNGTTWTSATIAVANTANVPEVKLNGVDVPFPDFLVGSGFSFTANPAPFSSGARATVEVSYCDASGTPRLSITPVDVPGPPLMPPAISVAYDSTCRVSWAEDAVATHYVVRVNWYVWYSDGSSGAGIHHFTTGTYGRRVDRPPFEIAGTDLWPAHVAQSSITDAGGWIDVTATNYAGDASAGGNVAGEAFGSIVALVTSRSCSLVGSF